MEWQTWPHDSLMSPFKPGLRFLIYVVHLKGYKENVSRATSTWYAPKKPSNGHRQIKPDRPASYSLQPGTSDAELSILATFPSVSVEHEVTIHLVDVELPPLMADGAGLCTKS